MKKFSLVLVLALLVAGGVFAQYVPYEFDDGGMSGLSIVSIDYRDARAGSNSLSITYSASEAYGTVKFYFTAYYKDPLRIGESTRTWTNTERITRPRASSTWSWGTIPSNIQRIVIRAEKQ